MKPDDDFATGLDAALLWRLDALDDVLVQDHDFDDDEDLIDDDEDEACLRYTDELL